MLYNSLLILRVKLVQVYFEDKKDKSSFLYKIFSVDSVKVQNFLNILLYTFVFNSFLKGVVLSLQSIHG